MTTQYSFATEAECRRLTSEANIPGLALAVIRDGQLDRCICCGVRDTRSSAPVDEDTVFDAASLSKPVFAHAVLQLADQGRLSLDAPLDGYLPGYMAADANAWAPLITARHVLAHTSGLPNWRSVDLPLKPHFRPGERFSYSGEGFLYLQRVVEAVTGERLHALMERLVLRPFGMDRSGFVWDWRFEPNRAHPHDPFGRPALGTKPGEGNAAATLQTTATDYARFLLRVLDGSALRPETARAWLAPQAVVRHAGFVCLGESAEDTATGVAWGLGWGLEPGEGTFFHWGDNGPYKAFAVGSLQRRDALVFFANGASGLSIVPELVAALMPGGRPSLTWLDYARYDAPGRRLLRAARAHGIAAVWQEVEDAGLGDDDLPWIAQGLSAAGMEKDSLWLRERIKERQAASPLSLVGLLGARAMLERCRR